MPGGPTPKPKGARLAGGRGGRDRPGGKESPGGSRGCGWGGPAGPPG